MAVPPVPGTGPVAAISAARGSARTGQALAEPAVKTTAAPTLEQLLQAVAEVQHAVVPVARDLHFSLDQETGRTIVRVIDSATNEVIRQIPSEELVAIAHALSRLQGLFVKQQA